MRDNANFALPSFTLKTKFNGILMNVNVILMNINGIFMRVLRLEKTQMLRKNSSAFLSANFSFFTKANPFHAVRGIVAGLIEKVLVLQTLVRCSHRRLSLGQTRTSGLFFQQQKKPAKAGVGAVLASAAMLGFVSTALWAVPVQGLASSPPMSSQVISQENTNPGSNSWRITNTAAAHEIEGYASAVSVNRGDQIQFFVNTAEPAYTLEIFRIGWYGGAGARSMGPAITLPGVVQDVPSPDLQTGMVACDWTDPYTLSVPNDPDPTVWTSGMYLAKLTALTSGKQSVIPFVVRDDQRPSSLLFQSSVNTFQAYNYYGGTSLYTNVNKGSTDPNVYSGKAAVKVSFDRPYQYDGSGQIFSFEVNMVRWLERNGYDVTYSTDVDTDRDAASLLQHRAFLIVGHDEYWTWQMRDNVESARNNGVNIGYFGGNSSFWQVRYEPNNANTPSRVLVGYKGTALQQDPYALDNDPSNDYLITTKFQNAPVNRRQDQLFGLMDNAASSSVRGDVIVTNTSNALFSGTGLRDGDRIINALGYEVDYISPSSPWKSFVRMGHSPFANSITGATSYGDMGYYQLGNGTTVFSVGSTDWSWALDNYGRESITPVSPAAQRLTQNVLEVFGALAAGASPPPPPSAPANLTAAGGDSSVTLTWASVPGATSYNVYQGTYSQGESLSPVQMVPGTGTSVTVTGLTDGTKYFFVVQAASAYGTSPSSNEAGAAPVSPLPAAPAGLTAAAGNASVTLSWTAVAGATSYNIYKATCSGCEAMPSTLTVSGSSTSATATGLTNGTKYFFVVQAINAYGHSRSSNEASAAPIPPLPAAPTGLTATAGNASVTLNWTAVAGATSYNVYMATCSRCEARPSVLTASGSSTSAVVTGLTNGTKYFFVLQAVNASGHSPSSNEASATPR